MSNGMHLFERVTRDLQVMHNEENLADLRTASGDYYCTSRKIEVLQQELTAELTKEQVVKLRELQDYFSYLESSSGDIYYNQGFADGISLMMQSLMWEAVRS
ncbi:protein of unknown function (DUF2164 family) [Sporomusaceae bacterium BoRhaA]|uniref:hypothetical protein n=1 Tax=Pelorhabdus rhamnosifermentans TaxID=2772457 RepID=UPI001C05F721|nr:hypothetical protein [Pelorhabdus rhamnosifermentans]MBU2702446.1 protein of unknown function (DUF2164 family) [Pelorhabdus rhamnosifermentans]